LFITVCGQKGGVAKTCTSIHLASVWHSEGKEVLMKAKGRHDPCVLPRAVPMVDAMVAIVLADHLLLNQAQCGLINS